jgi:hypothetical protein
VDDTDHIAAALKTTDHQIDEILSTTYLELKARFKEDEEATMVYKGRSGLTAQELEDPPTTYSSYAERLPTPHTATYFLDHCGTRALKRLSSPGGNGHEDREGFWKLRLVGNGT